jgi:opacity protein-like surface antigen
MSIRTASSRRALSVALGLLLIVSAASARWSRRNEYSDFSRFSLSLGGGFGFTEGHQGMLDLKTELQFGLTSRIRFGLGIGYMKSEGRHGFGEDWNDGREEMKAGQPEQNVSQAQTDRDGYIRGYRQDFRVIPLSLNVYYALPLGRRWSIFATGGGSYYFGSFRGAGERQDKNAWGGQGGLGVEFRLTQRLLLVAEGNYRFAEFRGVNSFQPAGQALLADGSANNCDVGTEWRHYSRMDLNGFGFRAGVKFGF